MPIVSHVARVCLDLDDVTNGLDDLVALQDLSLTGKRTALLDVKITGQASECWHDRFVQSWVFALLSPLHDIVWQRLHFETGPKT